jgi:hypothetical protein
MRTAAVVVLLLVFAVAADIGHFCAEKVQAAHVNSLADQVAFGADYVASHDGWIKLEIQSWEISSYLAAGLGVCALAWLGGAAVSPELRIGRPIRRTVRGSILGAILFGLGLAAWSVASWATSEVPGYEFDRWHMEIMWLIGSLVGAGSGAAIGAGLGAVAFFQRRPPDAD